jgi:large subunit ribosomal protein L10
MAITKQKKSEILADLENEFKTSKSTAFTAYSGITVTQIQELRRKLREGSARMIIAKKTLIQLAAKNAGLKEIPAESMEGPVAAVFSHEDEMAGLQILHGAKEDFEQVEILGGVFDGEVLDKAKAQQLAQLPSKQALLGQIVGLLISPLRGFVGVGGGLVGGFVRVLDSVREQKEAKA